MYNRLKNIGLEQIRKLLPTQKGMALGDDFFIVDVTYNEELEFLKFPCRTDAYIAVYCKTGCVNVSLNVSTYSLTAGTLIFSTPGNIIKLKEDQSDDLKACSFLVLAISKSFLATINLDFKRIFEEGGISMSNPCVTLPEIYRDYSIKYIELFNDLINQEFNNKREAVGSLVASLLYMLSGMFVSANYEVHEVQSTPSNTRLKLLYDHFMSLVTEFHASERNMGFYALRLGITPKYLSKLVKQVSGRSGPDWIDSFVILEAKNMLKYSDDTIKEIVYNLHFPNTSVFYKFFKSHTGMTPSEYRNS